MPLPYGAFDKASSGNHDFPIKVLIKILKGNIANKGLIALAGSVIFRAVLPATTSSSLQILIVDGFEFDELSGHRKKLVRGKLP